MCGAWSTAGAPSCTRARTRGAARAISSSGRLATSSISCASPWAACPRTRAGGRRAGRVDGGGAGGWRGRGEPAGALGGRARSPAPAVAARRDRDWVRFDRAEYGVAPGQAAVAYDGTRLLGGGWIAETVAAREGVVDAAAA